MTKLLVSVRSVTESRVALAAGVDLIDVKEPRRGPLGAADASVIADIVADIAGRVPVSAALGELVDFNAAQFSALTGIRHGSAGLRYAKIGLAGCGGRFDWPKFWQAAFSTLPTGIAPVAAIYADFVAANSPAPLAVFDQATTLGAGTLLIDTWQKGPAGLLDHWPLDQLARFVHDARRRQFAVVLAGGLTRQTIPAVLALQPDYVAIRGAACRGPRDGMIDAGCLRELRQMIVDHTNRNCGRPFVDRAAAFG